MMSEMTCFVLLLIFLSHSLAAQTSTATPAPTVDSLCLSEILISTPQPYDPAQIAAAQRKAESAREAIRQGAKFADIAKEYSDGPLAGLGGALGLFKRGQLAKSIEDKVFAMKVGDVTDVIRTKQGFTILKVAECGTVPESKPQAETNSSDQKSRPDFGLGIGARGRQLGQLEILSDTRGVHFGPYLQGLLVTVRKNWYMLIPETAQMKKARLAIEFAITKDGQVADMRLVASSGDVALDRAAWGSIINSNPFPALPSEFTGRYLALRLRYYYNPDRSDLAPTGPPRSPSVHQSDQPLALESVKVCRGSNEDAPGCVTPPRQISAPNPKYPKRERKAHHQGTVTLTLVVNPDGAPTNIVVLRTLSDAFDKAAVDAVKRWRFAPATKDGKPVALKVGVDIAFHLD